MNTEDAKAVLAEITESVDFDDFLASLCGDEMVEEVGFDLSEMREYFHRKNYDFSEEVIRRHIAMAALNGKIGYGSREGKEYVGFVLIIRSLSLQRGLILLNIENSL